MGKNGWKYWRNLALVNGRDTNSRGRHGTHLSQYHSISSPVKTKSPSTRVCDATVFGSRSEARLEMDATVGWSGKGVGICGVAPSRRPDDGVRCSWG